MKTCTLSQAKQKLGQLADAALKGHPTVIVRDGRRVVLQAYEWSDQPGEFDALIQSGKDSPHRELTPKVLNEIWKRGRAPAKG